jgi:molybdate transport system substrate-binding protein
MSQDVDRRWKRITAVAMLTVVASATACGTDQDRTTSITVYASASLIKSFTAIGRGFEAANPGYSVEFVFAGSQELSVAVADGAAVDVFASGNTADMTAVQSAGLASGAPVPFAANRLVLVVPAGNPGHVVSLAELTRPGTRVAVCGAEGACGAATELAQHRAGVQLHPQLSEPTSRAVLDDVTAGKADAGIVFRTEAEAAGDKVSVVELPGDVDDATSWITVINGTHLAGEAGQFVQEVTGPRGRQILQDDGFSEPLKNPDG